jgi:hypothetical protein
VRILVVGSCSKRKLKQHENAPACSDLVSKESLDKWRTLLSGSLVRARDMYTGSLNRELVRGVDLLRTIPSVEVQLVIISAGFGVVDEDELIPPYDCSFSGLQKREILARAHDLRIEHDFAHVCLTGFDMVYLALGKNYLLTLGDEWMSVSKPLIVGFDRNFTGPGILCIAANHRTVKAFSSKGFTIHGVVGFKGDLFRILAEFALGTDDPHVEVMSWKYSEHLRDLVYRLGGL